MIRRLANQVSISNRVFGLVVLVMTFLGAVLSVASSADSRSAVAKTNRTAMQLKTTVTQQGKDERCLRSVVGQLTERNVTLSRLSAQRTLADDRRTNAEQVRQGWATAEQRIFQRALHATSAATQTQLRAAFTHANRGYLRADDRWKQLDKRYKAVNRKYLDASKTHPVPKLKCTSSGHLDQVPPVITKTRTQTVSPPTLAPSTTTKTVTIPGPTTTRVVPGPTRTITVCRRHNGRSC